MAAEDGRLVARVSEPAWRLIFTAPAARLAGRWRARPEESRILARNVRSPKEYQQYNPNMIGGDLGGGASARRAVSLTGCGTAPRSFSTSDSSGT